MTKKKIKYEMTLREKIEMVRMSIRAVTRKYKNSRLITGTPAIGKSKAVIDELEIENVKFKHILGGIKSARTLFMTLTENNKKDLVLFFDDVNAILKKEECRELLRVAVSNEKKRIITYRDSWLDKRKRKYPPELNFKSRIIIATNIPRKKIDPAITSRTSAIEILADKYECIEYIKQNLKASPPDNIPLKWKQEVYDYITKEIEMDSVKQMDFRIFEDCCLWRCAEMEPELWKKLICTLIT